MPYLITLTLLLAPSYAIRFNLFGLPTNILMLWVLFVWLIFIINQSINNRWPGFVKFIKLIDKKILFLTSFFFLAGLISLFWQGISVEKFGQFIVLFLQPISLFFIGHYVWQQNPYSRRFILYTLYFILAAMGIYSIIQYFTLLGLPPAYWGNSVEPKRALSFFFHPNFFALFTAPLLAFLIPDAAQNLKSKILNLKSLAWILGAIGLGLSLSRAGWLGLGVAGLVYLIWFADKTIKKFATITVIVIVMLIISMPNLRWRFMMPFYGEKSAVSRISLWETGWKGVKESPLLGLGLTGFGKNWNRLNTDPNLDTHNLPHNIFLSLWLETGLLGLISFVGIAYIFIRRGFRSSVIPDPDPGSTNIDSRFRGNDNIKLGVALFLVALITQGLLDNPYFKNDLAMVFWIVLSLAIKNKGGTHEA